MAEDVSAFFDADDDFVTQALLDGVAVRGHFDNGYLEVMGIATRETRFTLPSVAAATATSSSVFVVGAVTYRVRGEPQHDGTGVCTLRLERQP